MIQSSLARIAALFLLAATMLCGQYPYPRTRRVAPGAVAPPGASAPKGVLLVFKGKLKVLDKKKIVIETDTAELLTIKLTSRTKFLDQGAQVKPAAIDLETPLTVEANQDSDASLLAVNVSVDSAGKPADKSAQDKPAAKPD